jgi:hypothetical protein
LETSEGGAFRLIFIVSYLDKNFNNCEERIISRPFTVNSNRKKRSKGSPYFDSRLTDEGKCVPVIQGIKPEFGPTDRETEVWIKGFGFDRTCVEFGDIICEVVDVQESIQRLCR